MKGETKGAGDGKNRLEKSYFDVLGLCCSSEVALVEKILKPLNGVREVSVIVPSKTVVVLHDPALISPFDIVKVLNNAKLEANVRVRGERKYRKKWPSPFAVACGVLLVLSFLKFVYRPFQWLAIGAVAVGIYPVVLRAISSVRHFRLDINILMLIAVAGSIALKDYWEAGTIVFLFTTAEWLESRASHKATAVMSSLMNIAPERAVIAETGEEVAVDEIKIGTVLAVKPGDSIPIDGLVVEGKCEVDEKALTGESFPVAKQVDSTVWAGTINVNGYVSVKTTALAEDCVVASMAKLVEEAQSNKSRTQRFIDKCAIYYTPAVVIISACLAVIPVAVRVHNRNEWYHLALVVLVSACPCALILSTPIATFCALSKAAESGLLIKGAEYLETLAKIKIMAFDKTGTITRGEFSVSDFHSLKDDVGLESLLYWVSSIEGKSSHPMAAALIDYARSNSIEAKPDEAEEFQNFPGEGIYGKIDGREIYVGNRKIAIRAGCAMVPTWEGIAQEGKSIGYIFLGSSPAGIFSLSDICRTGVSEALKELKSMGIKTAMLTGDSQAAAKYAKDQLVDALDEVHAELLPQDKARLIKEFQYDSPTGMVGDGLNDAPALATADIGISMGISGSALANDTGHIILLSNDIRKVPMAANLAKKTRRKIVENIFLSIFTKAAIIALAIAGHPLVWAAVLADVGTCLLVIFNSMLLLRGDGLHSHAHGCDSTHASSSHCHANNCSSVKEKKVSCRRRKCSSKACMPPNSVSSENEKCCGFEKKHQLFVHLDQPREAERHEHQEKTKHCCSTGKVEKFRSMKCASQPCAKSGCKSGCENNKPNKDGCCDPEAQDMADNLKMQNVSNHGCTTHSNATPCTDETWSSSTGVLDHDHDCDHDIANKEVPHCHGPHKANDCERSDSITEETRDCLSDVSVNRCGAHSHCCSGAKEEPGNAVKICDEQDLNRVWSGGCMGRDSSPARSECVAARGCCQSFRKECCGSSPGFGGVGLLEIVTE